MSTVCRLDLRDTGCSVVGNRVHQVMVAAHRSELIATQVIEREVDGATSAVSRLDGDVSLGDHLCPVDIRVVAHFRSAVLWLC